MPPGTAGHVGWHELGSSDWQAGFAFYAALFGWTKGEAFEMGPMGTYQLFMAGAAAIGGMMTRPGPSAWLYYIMVDAAGAAVQRVLAGGGRVLNGPQLVPGGSWAAQCTDPNGVPFGLNSGVA